MGFILALFSFTPKAQDFIKIDASFYSTVLDEARMIDIYLPADYYLNTDQEYAAIYFLHGGNGNQNAGNTQALWYYNTHSADTSIQSPPAIFVCPDGSCGPYMGSMWANSELYGQFEDFLVQDVITFVEDNFRAVPQKEFRFITGWSMGGMGSSNIAANNPDMFRGCIPCIAGLSMPDTCLSGWRSGCYLENGSYDLSYTGGGFMTQVMFTICGAYSPNLSLSPYYVDFPFDTLGNWNDDVLERWYEYDVSRKVKDLPDEDELAWFIICGTQDELLSYPACLVFADSLDAYSIEHDQNYFDGVHEFDIESWLLAIHWIDSIIGNSYQAMGISIMEPDPFSMNVFPNPCNASFTLEIESREPMPMQITLWDQDGRMVRTYDMADKSIGTYHSTFDISGLSPGIYFCRVMTGSHTVTRKLIKME